MICTPEFDSIISDSSPTFNANDAFSNDGCISRLPNGPKSPLRFAELQSLSLSAYSSNTSLNLSSPFASLTIASLNSFNSSIASSLLLVIFFVIYVNIYVGSNDFVNL